VPDDSTIVFTLEEPLNIFPKLLAMPVAAVVPAPVPDGFDQRPVGSGPWRFVSWSHDDLLVLARNERWWGGPAAEDTLRIRIIPEPLTQAAEYESGGLSVVEIPFSETRRWEQTNPDELQRRPTIRDLYIAINTRRGPLRDVRVRRALNHAVDVETILKTAMANRGARGGLIPPGILGYDSTRAPYPGTRRPPGACWSRRATPTASRSSSGAASGPSWPGGPGGAAGPRRAGHQGRDRRAGRAERARHGAQRRGRSLPG
jgi:ABC-type transport system substrate-binding protein